MPDEVLDKILSDLDQIETLEEVVVGGIGEPTMHPRIKEVLERLNKYNLILTSNGASLSEDLIESIVDNVDQLVISIDGLSDQFFSIRGFELEVVIHHVKAINAIKSRKKSRTPQLLFQISSVNLERLNS